MDGNRRPWSFLPAKPGGFTRFDSTGCLDCIVSSINLLTIRVSCPICMSLWENHSLSTPGLSPNSVVQNRVGWHRGVPTTDYSYSNGVIRSRMFNVVFFLTDNGAEDGCVVALPGSHKSNFDLTWKNYKGLEMPGAIAVTGKAGDVLMFLRNRHPRWAA